MNVTKIIFSPTGGTKQVVDALTAGLAGNAAEIDLTSPKTDFTTVKFGADDVVVIGVPSYGGLVPLLATERLAKMQGNGAKCVIVCVYGNRAYEDTLVELNDVAEESGFKVIAAAAAIAEHSIARQYATGRPDKEDKAELNSFGAKIAEKINADNMSKPAIPGNRPHKKRGGSPSVPQAGEKCDGCGLCVKVCPAQAIDSNTKIADAAKCIGCMRCVAQCPNSARKLDENRVLAIGAMLKEVCSVRKDNELYL